MSIEVSVPDGAIGIEVIAGPAQTFWMVVDRDEAGHPTEIRRMRDVAVVRDHRGEVTGLSVGCHPSRGMLDPEDVVVMGPDIVTLAERPVPPVLVDLDCYAVLGDHKAASLARWHEDHPAGPQTPAEHIEEQALRAGFVRRQHRPVER